MTRTSTPVQQVERCATHNVEYVAVDGRTAWQQMTHHIAADGPCTLAPTSERLTVHRCCNACGNDLGDANPLELECAVQGIPMPDARLECSTCAPALDGADQYGPPIPRVGVLERANGTRIDVGFVPLERPGMFLLVAADHTPLLVDGDETLTVDYSEDHHKIVWLLAPRHTPAAPAPRKDHADAAHGQTDR